MVSMTMMALSLSLASAGCSTPEGLLPRVSFVVQKDVVYSRGPDFELRADVYIPESSEQKPGILMLHGGSWQRGNKERMSDVAALLAAQGFVVFNVNYRLAPDHPYPAQLEDMQKALSHMKSHAIPYSLDPQRIGVVGYSAGGHLALLFGMLQLDPNVQAIATAGAPTDLTEFGEINATRRLLNAGLSEEPERYRRASPFYLATRSGPPTLLVHGTYDWIVPVAHARKMEKAVKQDGGDIELIEIPAGHLSITAGVNEEAVLAMISFFRTRFYRD